MSVHRAGGTVWFIFIQHDLKLLNVNPEWWLCTTDITGALTPYVSEICKVKGSHLCPLTPDCFSGVCWTCVLSAEECGEVRCCRESPLPGWARPKTHPPQCPAGTHLWTSPWAWIEITTIQNMSMEQNLKCSFEQNFFVIKIEELKNNPQQSLEAHYKGLSVFKRITNRKRKFIP